MNYFSKNIRYLRKQNNMSQDTLADILNYKSFTTIQKWESNKSEPTLSTLHELAQIFDVSIEELVNVDLENYEKTSPSKSSSINKELSEQEQSLLNNYNNSNSEGQEKIISYSRDISNLYPYEPTREEMLEYMDGIQYAAYGGGTLDELSDEELYQIYKVLRENE